MFDHLVVDSSGFLHNGPISQNGKNVYTCQEVVDEIKDKQTLSRLQLLPYELILIDSDVETLKYVVEFAKINGDFKQLSSVDLKLMSVTYKLKKQYPDQTVACMTSDFSIQNCLQQLGLQIISPLDDMTIKQSRKIALRCHGCYHVLYDLTKLKNDFCPKCGNIDTLKRVQYIENDDGTKKVFVNYKKPIRVKGTNRQLPAPRGGKHANNPILAPDQWVRKDKKSKFDIMERKTLSRDFVLEDPAYLVRSNPFAQRVIKM